MIKQFFILALFTSFSYISVAQQLNPIETIETGKGLTKKKVYRKCGIDLTPTQLLTLVRNDANLQQYYKPMALNYAASTLLNSTAGILVLWPVTESFYKSNPNWTLAIIGLGCYAIAIPFTKGYQKHTTKAIQYYNSGYKETAKNELNIGMMQHGFGISLKF
jgi:hypothetical protein